MPSGVDFCEKFARDALSRSAAVARGVRVREEVLRGKFRLSDEIERALGGADGDGDELDARGVEDGLDVAPELMANSQQKNHPKLRMNTTTERSPGVPNWSARSTRTPSTARWTMVPRRAA